MPQITVNHSGVVETRFSTSSSGHDVTGGIMGKIQSACRIAKQSKGKTRVLIGRLGSPVAKDIVMDDGKLESALETGVFTEMLLSADQL